MSTGNFLNPILFFCQIFLVTFLTIFTLKKGKVWIGAWIVLLSLCMNSFILKQINLFGLNVTASEGLAVGYLLGFNLVQEFFGRQEAKKMIFLSLFCSLCFVILTEIHLLFIPSEQDLTQELYFGIFKFMPRLFVASIISFVTVQFFDLFLFGMLKERFQGKRLGLRLIISLFCSQALDTIIFSYLALFNVVSNLSHVILFCLLIKFCVILVSSFVITLSKRFITIYETV